MIIVYDVILFLRNLAFLHKPNPLPWQFTGEEQVANPKEDNTIEGEPREYKQWSTADVV